LSVARRPDDDHIVNLENFVMSSRYATE